MAGTSTKTGLVTLRLPVEVLEKARVNARRKEVTLSQYLGKILVLQIGRRR